VRDRVGSVTRPVRELKGFAKVALAAGEARDVTLPLTPADLAFWRADQTFAPEAGEFDVYVGANSNASLTATFRLEAEP
jgi:beta-glucosidase